MSFYQYILFTEASQFQMLDSTGNLQLSFQSFGEFELAKIEQPVVFQINAESANYAHKQIWKIRTHPQYYQALCFVQGKLSEQDQNLIDGFNLTTTQQSECVETFLQLETAFKVREEPLYRDDRLLRYLWSRPDFILKAYPDWQEPRFYLYPLLQALSFDELDCFTWRNQLLANKLLSNANLVDRQRECSHCRSAQLSFIDVCPSCESIDIHKQVALHCFICGHVAPQDEFLRQGILNCPKCETQLKHIGSDYDRPIENYSCRQCQHFFIEGQVKARCMVCAQQLETEDLQVHEIHHLQLSEYGKITALRGHTADMLEIFSGKNFVANEVFVHDLDWLLIQSDRYQEIEFAVLGLGFVNLLELIKLSNESQIIAKIEALAERIKVLLRGPDLCTRSTENMIWMLLPQTGRQGLLGLKERLTTAISSLQQSDVDSQKLRCEFTEYSAAKRIENETAELLLARLRAEIF